MIVCVQFVTALAQNEFKFFSMLYAESRLEGQRFIALLTSPCTVHLHLHPSPQKIFPIISGTDVNQR